VRFFASFKFRKPPIVTVLPSIAGTMTSADFWQFSHTSLYGFLTSKFI
jgi:hypothetical protein